MKKLILTLILGAFALSGYAQMNTFGGIGLRVNDTTTYQTNASAYHAAGYRDMYFNNQATNKHFDIWNGSSYQHVFTFGGGSGGGSQSLQDVITISDILTLPVAITSSDPVSISTDDGAGHTTALVIDPNGESSLIRDDGADLNGVDLLAGYAAIFSGATTHGNAVVKSEIVGGTTATSTLSASNNGGTNTTSIVATPTALALTINNSTGSNGDVLKKTAGVWGFAADAGGAGTVTSVSVTTANGVSGSVATATTTPAISLTLGAITPTSVNSVVLSGSSTPTLAVTGTSTISGTHAGTSSGTNTGDQTTVTGNSGTATALQNSRTIGTVTGDATSAGSSFDGTANNTNSVTVTKVNGVAFSGLATGILKNTTTTGVPSIAINSDLPVMSATVGGAVPTPPNNTTTFLRGDGTFATPSGGGTVTNVSALTLGTTGTDLSSSVASATTTPVITLNVPTASGSNRGALSSTDWTTFNGKAPIASPTFTGTVTIPNVLPVTNLTSLTNSRTLTTTGAIVQGDNLNIVYGNHASTPFNITVDLLTAGSQVNVINIGAATVTLIAGSGVTLPGAGTVTLLSGSNAVIIYRVAATPEVYTGTGGSVSSGTAGQLAAYTSSTVVGGTTTGTGVLTALGVNVGSAGAPILFNGAAGTFASGVATNLTGTAPGLTSGISNALKSATTTVDVSATTAPTSGQVLTATSSTAATWQTLSTTGWALTGTSTLTGAATIAGTSTNTLKFTFDGLGATQPNGTGHWLANNTAATSGNQQWSPSTVWEGQGWKTNATAASQSVKFTAYVIPVQSTVNPTSEWYLNSSINGAAYTGAFSVNSAGRGIFYDALWIQGSRLLYFNGNGTMTTLANTQMLFRSDWSSTANTVWRFTNQVSGNAYANTSGTISEIGLTGSGFAPGSGSGTFNEILLSNFVNQTGGANGQVTWVNSNPTITAAVNVTGYDWNPITPANITGTHYSFRATSGNQWFAGKTIYDATITAGGTTGNQTINKPSGTVNIAAAGTTVTVTNSFCTTSSIVTAVIRTNDATAYLKNVVPGSGSFVINLGAASTAEVSIGFIVLN